MRPGQRAGRMQVADGILVVDKPAGPTSHDVVDRVRRAIRIRRVGHTGTLDPMATGVLPLVIGRATRLARFLTASTKIYEARIRLGVETDTYDASGQVVGPAGAFRPVVDRADIERALSAFRGTYEQTPPPFSARKVGGTRAYEKARRGEVVRPAPTVVTVTELSVRSADADTVTVRVTCSAGFYVRSLAHDLGERLGTGAHLEALRRLASGGFGLEQAVPLEVVEREGPAALERALPLDQALPYLPAVRLSDEGARRARHGALVGPGDMAERLEQGVADTVRLLAPEGTLIALARASGTAGSLHPFVVLG